MMTFTSPFHPQPLCDPDGIVCGYQTFPTEGPKTAGENVKQNYSNLEIKMDSRKTEQNNSNAPGRKKRQQTKRRVHHVATECSVFYRDFEIASQYLQRL